MRKIKVVVMFAASNEVELEVPEMLSGDELREHVRGLLEPLPEVLKNCEFEFPMEALIEGDEETIDIG